jgi:hypothetical protein
MKPTSAFLIAIAAFVVNPCTGSPALAQSPESPTLAEGPARNPSQDQAQPRVFDKADGVAALTDRPKFERWRFGWPWKPLGGTSSASAFRHDRRIAIGCLRSRRWWRRRPWGGLKELLG